MTRDVYTGAPTDVYRLLGMIVGNGVICGRVSVDDDRGYQGAHQSSGSRMCQVVVESAITIVDPRSGYGLSTVRRPVADRRSVKVRCTS
jgi:hypothetical protein